MIGWTIPPTEPPLAAMPAARIFLHVNHVGMIATDGTKRDPDPNPIHQASGSCQCQIAKAECK